jgi:hypothetical protein
METLRFHCATKVALCQCRTPHYDMPSRRLFWSHLAARNWWSRPRGPHCAPIHIRYPVQAIQPFDFDLQQFIGALDSLNTIKPFLKSFSDHFMAESPLRWDLQHKEFLDSFDCRVPDTVYWSQIMWYHVVKLETVNLGDLGDPEVSVVWPWGSGPVLRAVALC